jgi:hypothetical protein
MAGGDSTKSALPRLHSGAALRLGMTNHFGNPVSGAPGGFRDEVSPASAAEVGETAVPDVLGVRVFAPALGVPAVLALAAAPQGAAAVLAAPEALAAPGALAVPAAPASPAGELAFPGEPGATAVWAALAGLAALVAAVPPALPGRA